CHTSFDQLAPMVASENTTVARASDHRRPTVSPSQPPPHEPSPNPTSAALIAQPKVVRSVPKSSITLGATMPSSCASIPSQISTSMQIPNVTTENAPSGARERASLKVVATASSPIVCAQGMAWGPVSGKRQCVSQGTGCPPPATNGFMPATARERNSGYPIGGTNHRHGIAVRACCPESLTQETVQDVNKAYHPDPDLKDM